MDPDDLVALRRTITECESRCLHPSTQWLADLLADPHQPHSRQSQSPSFADISSADIHAQLLEATQDAADADALLIAQSYFRCGQYDRVAHILRDCKSSKARFLSIYSQHLAIERQRTLHHLHNDPKEFKARQARLLQVLRDASEPFLLYLKGRILKLLDKRFAATACLVKTVNLNPWVWSAWVELGQCLQDAEEYAAIQSMLPKHPMSHLFGVQVMIGFHTPSEEDMQTINQLLEMFPSSIYLLSQKALIHYHQKDWAQAEKLYDHILKEDPYRVDDMDIYSNILYVMEKRTKLSRLAHELIAQDKDRPEVCCIVGNHYSLQGEHEKAIKYFRRAVEIDEKYLSAWTLMGHEYVEMKNSQSAIQAYRRAVDLNRRDYRAWFGLGQAYELLSMHEYALHYYHRATALRPYDVRVWQAMGLCYTDLNRPREAIECFKRAQIESDPHDILLDQKIADLYEILGEKSSAVQHHKRVVDICRAAGKSAAEYARSCIYISLYYFAHKDWDKGNQPPPEIAKKNQETAMKYLLMVSESNAEESGYAADVIRKIKNHSMPIPSAPVELRYVPSG